MPFIKTASVAGLLMLVLSSVAAEGGGPHWQKLTPGLLQQAQQEARLVLVDLSAEWCRFCKKMDRITWRDPQVLNAIDKYYIPARIQDEKDPVLAETPRQYGRPAFFVLNAKGEEIARKRGYLDPKFMHWMLEGIAQEAGQ